jgi:hypothetical protein
VAHSHTVNLGAAPNESERPREASPHGLDAALARLRTFDATSGPHPNPTHRRIQSIATGSNNQAADHGLESTISNPNSSAGIVTFTAERNKTFHAAGSSTVFEALTSHLGRYNGLEMTSTSH